MLSWERIDWQLRSFSTSDWFFVVVHLYRNALNEEHPLWRCRWSHLLSLLVGEQNHNVISVPQAELGLACCSATASVMSEVFALLCAPPWKTLCRTVSGSGETSTIWIHVSTRWLEAVRLEALSWWSPFVLGWLRGLGWHAERTCYQNTGRVMRLHSEGRMQVWWWWCDKQRFLCLWWWWWWQQRSQCWWGLSDTKIPMTLWVIIICLMGFYI